MSDSSGNANVRGVGFFVSLAGRLRSRVQELTFFHIRTAVGRGEGAFYHPWDIGDVVVFARPRFETG